MDNRPLAREHLRVASVNAIKGVYTSSISRSVLPSGGDQRGSDDLVLHQSVPGREDEAVLTLVPVAVFLEVRQT